MRDEAISVVRAGAPEDALTQRRQAFMRYHGQGHEIEILLPDRALEQDDIPRYGGPLRENTATNSAAQCQA